MSSQWTGKGSGTRWTDPANWSAGVPGSGDDAGFTGAIAVHATLVAGTTLTTGALLIDQAKLSLATGSLAFAPAPTQGSPTVDLTIDDRGTLTVQQGAHLSGSNVAEIGNGSGGRLVLHGSLAEGTGVIDHGTLDIVGPHGHWIMGAGGLSLNDGTLNIGAGGTLDGGGALSRYPDADLRLEGRSTAVVAGGRVHVAGLFVGDQSGIGTLTIQSGGTVITGSGTIGGPGQGEVNVTGAGSMLIATDGLTVGDSPHYSTLNVSDGGTVRCGSGGLTVLEGLGVYPTATVQTPFVQCLGGAIESYTGTATLGVLRFGTNPVDGGKTTYLAGYDGALVLSGGISTVTPDDTSLKVDISGGTVVLDHAAGDFASTIAFADGVTLELGVAGALGAATVDFGGPGDMTTLQIDVVASQDNVIENFAMGDRIDLSALSYADVVASFTPDDGNKRLTLTNSDHQRQSLVFAGTGPGLSHLAITSDGHGGTMITHG